MATDILVWGELEYDTPNGRLHPGVCQLLGKARQLADTNSARLLLALTARAHPDLEEAATLGVDRILCWETACADWQTERIVACLEQAVHAKQPDIVLLAATPRGRALAPRLAARLRTGITADCTELRLEAKRGLLQIRPAYGGSVMATIVCPDKRPAMATVRPHTFPLRTNEREQPAVERMDLPPNLPRERVALVDSTAAPLQETGIEQAEVIVAVGRGIGGPENIPVAARLARHLGGVLAASRTVVDLGWLPHSNQVGQSGRTVSPQLYVAIGISGAVQHLVGMQTAHTIVAINHDPEAPIFKAADLGIVADYAQVVPNLCRRLQEYNAGDSLEKKQNDREDCQ